jgi:L-histidine Nalpha-methyltransferase
MDSAGGEQTARGGSVRFEVRLSAAKLRQALLDEARASLALRPRELSPRWLYDARGSQLFEEITHLPEYYPTRTERAILQARAKEIAALSRAQTLVELGSGSSRKTRLLLSALEEGGGLRTFCPLDVSEPMLRAAAASISAEYPGVAVHAVVGDFERHLPELRGGGRRLLAFLGGTIGNFKPEARARFLARVAAWLGPGDTLLLGTDLLKSPSRLHAAYNDAAGVTAAFNLNVLSVLNRELGSDFASGAFEHRARFDPDQGWVEMLLCSKTKQTVRVPALGLQLCFEPKEALRTEVSCKFRPEQVETELHRAGLRLQQWWTDPDGDFALCLSGRRQ